MSNFATDETFQLTEIAAMPRGMTLAEAEHYLMTDELPLDDPFRDISHTLTPEERQAQEDEARAHEEFDTDGLSLEEATAFLSGESAITAAITAAAGGPQWHHERRDRDGQWTDTPGSGVISEVTKVAKSAAKKLTPAKIYKKHEHEAVIAHSADGKRRIKWNEDTKKFVVQRQSSTGWKDHKSLNKTQAYAEAKKTGWVEPGDEAPHAPSLKEAQDNRVRSATKERVQSDITETNRQKKIDASKPNTSPDVVAPKKIATLSPAKHIWIDPSAFKPANEGSSDFPVMSHEVASKMQKQLKPSFTPTERSAIIQYTNKWYYEVNSYLRGKGMQSDDKAYVDQMVSTLTKMMRPAPQNFTTMRGTTLDEFGVSSMDELASLVGKTGITKGFSSTSVDKPFGLGSLKHAVVVFRVPKGTPVSYIANVSDQPYEHEMLLPHGTRYRVAEARPPKADEPGGWRVVLEVIS